MARGKGAIDPKVSQKNGGTNVNFWCRWIANNTKLMFGIFLSIHVGTILLSVGLLLGGYNILPVVFDGLPLQMPDDIMFLRSEAWGNRNDDLKSDDTSVPSRKKRDLGFDMFDDIVSSMDHSHSDPSMTLNLEEDLTKQFLSMNPSSIADKLAGEALGLAKGSGDPQEILSDLRHDFIANKPFLQTVDECCDWNSNLSPLSKLNCRCDPHSHQAGVSKEKSDINRRRKRETIDPLDERRKTLTRLTLIYEDPQGNVLTKKNLMNIAKFEYSLYNNEDFRTKYCKFVKFQKALHCQTFTSILRFFDGSYAFEDDKFFDPSFTNISNIINLAHQSDRFKSILTYHLAVDADVNNNTNTAISRRTRSLVYFGYPYKEYLGTEGRKYMVEQRKLWQNWAAKDIRPQMNDFFEKGYEGLSFYYVSQSLYWSKALDSVVFDMCWLFAGFAFIYIFMLFQTGSFWITSFGMGSVLASFFGANLVYNIIIGYKFFGIFNVLALFIILGIGADDIFIFSDTWKLYSSVKFDTLDERLSVVFKRAAIAMFITSLTTMVAFFVSSFSPLLPISAFGTFAGLCILVNYLSVISFFPSALIMYHKYFEKYACCCCVGKKASVKEPPSVSSVRHNEGDESRPVSRSSMASVETVEKSSSSLQPYDDDKSTRNSDRVNAAVVKFLTTKFFRFVTNKYARLVILAIFLVLMALCAYSVSRMVFDNSQFRLFDPWTVEEKSKDLDTYGFMVNADEPTLDLVIAWGLGPQDLSACSKLEYDADNPCVGKTVWESIFSLNDETSQLGLLNFCKYMTTGLDPTMRDSLKIAYNSKTKENNVSCFMLDMEKFYEKEHTKYMYPAGLNFSLPITKTKMQTIMSYHPKVFANASISLVTKPFDMAVKYWLNNGYSNETVDDDRSKYSRYLGFKKDSSTDFGVQDDEDIKDYKLVYAGMVVSSTVPALRTDIYSAVPLLELWETFMDTEMLKMPPTLQHGFQQAYLWVWINILQNLFTQSFTAFGVGLALAFVVILMGTQNIITAMCATLMLGCVTCGVLSVIPLAGWKFGLLEALNFCLIVGLAVDYIVHLSEGYHMASFTGRLDRVRDTLEKVGISIVSGAITTLGSSFFMIFAQILFFKQFGIFIFCTIGLSMLFSLFVMLAAYSIFGPEGYFASFVPLCRDRLRYQEHQNDAKKGVENKGYAGETPM